MLWKNTVKIRKHTHHTKKCPGATTSTGGTPRQVILTAKLPY